MNKSLDESYTKAGFTNRLGFGDAAALIVVDFARAYVDTDAPLYAAAEDALASTIRIVAACRRANVPIVFTRVLYRDGAAEAGVFWRKAGGPLSCFVEGNPFGDFAIGIEPQPDDVIIDKHYASSFFGTDLASLLTNWRIDTAIITGVSTSGCVRATTLDACQHGFAPMVVRDAVADRHDGPHEANLFDLDAKYADVVSEGETLAYLEQVGRNSAN